MSDEIRFVKRPRPKAGDIYAAVVWRGDSPLPADKYFRYTQEDIDRLNARRAAVEVKQQAGEIS